MKIQCPKCKTAFRLDEAKIPAKGIRARCPKCKATFTIRKRVRKPASSAPGNKQKETNRAKVPASSAPGNKQKEANRAKVPVSSVPGNKQKEANRAKVPARKKVCESCNSLIESAQFAHFFEGRILCDACYKSAKKTSDRISRNSIGQNIKEVPIDFSKIPEGSPEVVSPVKKVPIFWVATTIACMLISFVVIYFFTDSSVPEKPQGKPEYEDGDAYYLEQAFGYSKMIVKTTNTIPSTAVWPEIEDIEEYVEYLGENQYAVNSWYDLTLNDGFIHRQYYLNILIRAGDTWESQSLEFYASDDY